MPSQRLAPDAILAVTNLAGLVTAIDEDPDSPDASWLTAPGANNATQVRVSFGTPTASPAGLQEFRVQLRKTNHSTNPSAVIELWENGVLVQAVVSTTTISSTSGQILAGTWDASVLGTADGSLVECRMVSTLGGGTPGNRASVEVGAIEWNAVLPYVGTGVFTLPALDGSGAGTVAAGATIGTGTFTLPALELTGVAANSRKLEEGFEVEGYENAGWTESVDAGTSLDPDYPASTLTGGSPRGWGSECIQFFRLGARTTSATSPTLPALSEGFYSFDILIGAENLSDGNERGLFSISTASVAPISVFIYQTSGNLRFRFKVETSPATFTTLDWGTNVALNQHYVIEFHWDTVGDAYEIWVDRTSVFSGSTTATTQPNRVILGGSDLSTGGGATFYIDRVGVDSAARLPGPFPELPPLTMTAAGTVLVQGVGNFTLPAISFHEPLTADSITWTADAVDITADAVTFPTSTATGDVLVSGTGTFNLPKLTGFGTGAGPSPWDVENLVAAAVSGSQIDLDWDAVSGTVLAFYEIERDGSVVATSGTNSYSDTGLTEDVEYSYRVRAIQSG